MTNRMRPGRRATGAPGYYKFTKFRSQLEIHFAKELDLRGIRWFYEPERLGEGRYLLDFYLPEYKSWVEVKGLLSSRDHLWLREVAEMLKNERRHRVFMYMQEKAFSVTLDGFQPMTHPAFWNILARKAEENIASTESDVENSTSADVPDAGVKADSDSSTSALKFDEQE